MVQISSYHSAFNLIKVGFDYKGAIDNYCSFFDEVVIAVNTSEDNTYDALLEYKEFKKYTHLNIYQCNFSYNDIDFDGKIKSFALQHCHSKYRCLLDLDERIPIGQRDMWRAVCQCLENIGYDGFAIASVNLCNDIYHCKDIGYKFYLHKDTITSRGILPSARQSNGKIDISKSDTTEPLRSDGSLGVFYFLRNDIEGLRTQEFPYVLHYWAVDPEQRIKQNRIWKPTWDNRAGYNVQDIILDKEALLKTKVFEHKLAID